MKVVMVVVVVGGGGVGGVAYRRNWYCYRGRGKLWPFSSPWLRLCSCEKFDSEQKLFKC